MNLPAFYFDIRKNDKESGIRIGRERGKREGKALGFGADLFRSTFNSMRMACGGRIGRCGSARRTGDDRYSYASNVCRFRVWGRLHWGRFLNRWDSASFARIFSRDESSERPLGYRIFFPTLQAGRAIPVCEFSEDFVFFLHRGRKTNSRPNFLSGREFYRS